MVHLPEPMYPRTKHVEKTLELLLRERLDVSMAEIERRVPECRNLPRKMLEEMIAGIKYRRSAWSDV